MYILFFFFFQRKTINVVKVNVVSPPNSEKGDRDLMLLFTSTVFSAY